MESGKRDTRIGNVGVGFFLSFLTPPQRQSRRFCMVFVLEVGMRVEWLRLYVGDMDTTVPVKHAIIHTHTCIRNNIPLC